MLLCSSERQAAVAEKYVNDVKVVDDDDDDKELPSPVVVVHQVPVQYVRPVPVDESTESHTISPCRGHVGDVEPRIALTHRPAPDMQGPHPCLLVHHHAGLGLD